MTERKTMQGTAARLHSQWYTSELSKPLLCFVSSTRPRMTLSSEKAMTACHLPVSGLPLSGCILALNGIVDGNI